MLVDHKRAMAPQADCQHSLLYGRAKERLERPTQSMPLHTRACCALTSLEHCWQSLLILHSGTLPRKLQLRISLGLFIEAVSFSKQSSIFGKSSIRCWLFWRCFTAVSHARQQQHQQQQSLPEHAASISASNKIACLPDLGPQRLRGQHSPHILHRTPPHHDLPQMPG